jgi:hypothetical protein
MSWLNRSAASPATAGVAIDVPNKVANELAGYVE